MSERIAPKVLSWASEVWGLGMTWIDQLSEALERHGTGNETASDWLQFVNAARLMAAGEDIWWCANHKHPSTGSVNDDLAYSMTTRDGCRFGWKRMIDIPEEETRDEKV